MVISNSAWAREILAILKKEFVCEGRSRAGALAGLLLGTVTVVALALANFNTKLAPASAAGMLWIGLLFSAAVALPRVFVSEEEQGTADLLRMCARPHAVFWGKVLFSFLSTLVQGLFLAFMFSLLGSLEVRHLDLFVCTIIAGSASLATAVTLCGAIVAQAQSRNLLSVALAMPLLLPQVFLAIEALRVPFGSGHLDSGWQAAGGLAGFAVILGCTGPYLYAAVWKQ